MTTPNASGRRLPLTTVAFSFTLICLPQSAAHAHPATPAVTPRPPGTITVTSHGIVSATQTWFQPDASGADVHYALVLHNKTHHESALGVTVSLTLTDTVGATASSNVIFTGIPPGGNFYLGSDMDGIGVANVDSLSLDASVTVQRTPVGRVILPPVTLTVEQHGLLPETTGVVRNPYKQSQQTWIDVVGGDFYVIYFNRHGRIVGALEDYDGLPVMSLNDTANSETFTMPDPPPVGATSAMGSLDPCASGVASTSQPGSFWGLSPSCVALQ